jgi:hypothetical protein
MHRTNNDELAPEVLLHRRISVFHSHPNILMAHAHFQDKRHFYLVTDLVEGDWLSRFSKVPGFNDASSTFSFWNSRLNCRQRVACSVGGKNVAVHEY